MSDKNKKVNTLMKWSGKKMLNEEIANKILSVGETRRSMRVRSCSNSLELTKCSSCGKEHVSRVNLCRDRVCPVCQWRLARKRAFEMLECLDIMNKDDKYKYQFLTLTQKNVEVSYLKKELKKINEAWKRVISSNRKNKPAGYARVVEITYNEKDKNFHPHQHVIIAWNRGQTPYKRLEWQNTWERALRVNYTPICRLRAIKPQKEQIKYTKAVLETFKYSIKANDILKMPNDIFGSFLGQISGSQVCSYTGIFRKTRQELKMEAQTKIEKDDKEEIKCSNCGSELSKAVFSWSLADQKYISK